MRQEQRSSDIPIRHAVVAWQPSFVRRGLNSAAPGEVAVFELFDPAEGRYAMTHGAGWYWWGVESESYLLDRLAWLKRTLVRDYGISSRRVEEAFAVIPEYRCR